MEIDIFLYLQVSSIYISIKCSELDHTFLILENFVIDFYEVV